MTEPTLPGNEEARLAALQRYNVVDTPPEPAFDDIARLISRICQTPVALVSFIDGDRQWFKAWLGFKSSSLPREIAFCTHTLLQNDILIVRDTQADPRFANNPLVVSPPSIRFYAGVSLMTPDGYAIGTLCVFDINPRDLTPHQMDALRVLARQVMALLELRRKDAVLSQAAAEAERLAQVSRPGSPALAQRIVDSVPQAYLVSVPERTVLYANTRFPPWGLTAGQVGGDGIRAMVHPDDAKGMDDHFGRLAAAKDGETLEIEYRVKDPQGMWRWFLSRDTAFARSEKDQVTQALGTAHDITERRTQDETLRQSEFRYRQWIETAREGIWALDAREQTTYANPRLGELLGYTMDEMLGAPLSSFLDEADQDMVGAHLERIRQGPGEARDFKLKRKDGADLWAVVSTVPVTDSGGRYVGAFLIVSDLTGRRQADPAIRESEERFRQLAETIRQVFWLSSADKTQVLYVSPAYEAVWGRSVQSLYDDPASFIEAIHPEDRERLMAVYQEQQQEAYELEYRIVLPDGSVRWMWSHTFPVRDSQGAVYRLAAITEDITERKEAEEALRRNEAGQRALFDAIPDLVFRFDAEGRFIDFQSALENRQELLMPPEAFLGRHYQEVLPPEVSAVMEAAFQRARAENAIQSFEYNLTLPNGQTHGYEARLSLDARGYGLVIVRNITRRKQAEAGLEAQTRLFQNLVAMARATVAVPALDATLQNVLDVSVLITGSTQGVLFVFDTRGRVTASLWSAGAKTEPSEHPDVAQLLDKGLEGQVLRERKPILVQDTQTDPRWIPFPGEIVLFGSALGLPIVYGDDLVGILTLLHEQKAYFTDEHLNLMEAAADQMALVLRNAQIYEQTRRQAQELFMLNSITRAAIESAGPDQLLQTLADHMGGLIGADGCFITLWDAVDRRPVPKAASGVVGMPDASQTVEPGEMTLTEAVLEAGHALIAEDVADTPYLSRRIAEQFPMRSVLGLPLIARDQKLGAVLIGFNERHTFTPEEVAFCEQAAVQMALALSNAMLYQAIGEERSRLRAIIDASRDGILLIGVNQRLLVCNQIAIQILGARGGPEDWIGKTILDALNELRRTAPNAARATLSEARRIQENDQSPGEGVYDVHGRILNWHHLPVRAQGVLLGRLVVMHDITEEHSLERVRNDLTHMMVHDLRSPLTAIMGASDALSETAAGLTPSEHSTVELIRDGADRMLNLVNDILDVSRLENNRMPIERQAVDIPALIIETLQLHMGQIEKKQIRLMNDTQAELPPANADGGLIERVIQNLLSNAVKYTPEGGALRITAAPVDTPRPMLMISVSDTGPGIPPEIQGRVFEKFVRGDHKEHGSGLGLAFCRLTVEAHDGRIWVESEPGTGTTFRFTLPLYEPGG